MGIKFDHAKGDVFGDVFASGMHMHALDSLCFKGSVRVLVLAHGTAWGSDSLLRQLLCLDVCRTYGWLVGWLVGIHSRKSNVYISFEHKHMSLIYKLV